MPDTIHCPFCGGNTFKLKYEVVFEYAYFLDGNAPGTCNDISFHPYLYDERLQKEANQYIECCDCAKKFPCYLEKGLLTNDRLKRILQCEYSFQ